jgi:AmmeMemoRadiSam system protein B
MWKWCLLSFVCVILLSSTFFLLTKKQEPPIVGIVVPHHDMVAGIRSAYFAKVSSEVSPKRIILISPNHSGTAQSSIVTTKRTWETASGTIQPALKIIEDIFVKEDDVVFSDEQGITSILGDVRTYFPDSEIIPILIKRSATYAETIDLVHKLYASCKDCLLITSIDFSHATHAQVAQLHDDVSLRALYTHDSVLAYKNAEVDSPESLVALIEWSRLHGVDTFSLFKHTNSGYLSGTAVGEVTTHVFGGYERGAKEEQFLSTTFMFAGDTLLGRNVTQQSSNPLSKLGERFFWGTDIAAINLEGVFSEDAEAKEGLSRKMPPKFLFDDAYAQILTSARINTVFSSNNHGYDGGEEGAEYTRSLMGGSSIRVVGSFTNDAKHISKYVDSGDIPVALVGINTATPFGEVIAEIRKLSTTHKVIVYLHWGSEYESVHNGMQSDIAHDLVDAGADLVLGSHPHVVQDIEVYKNVPIVYSLGNFIFDQKREDTAVGIVLSGRFTEKALEIFFIPVSTYITPEILDQNKNIEYVDALTSTIMSYKNGEGVFVFPF